MNDEALVALKAENEALKAHVIAQVTALNDFEKERDALQAQLKGAQEDLRGAVDALEKIHEASRDDEDWIIARITRNALAKLQEGK